MRALVWACWLWCGIASAQDFSQLSQLADLRLQEARLKLRDAIVRNRDASLMSCQARADEHCDSATLNEIQLALVDMQIKYAKAARSAPDSLRSAFKRIDEAVGETRTSVNELDEALGKLKSTREAGR